MATDRPVIAFDLHKVFLQPDLQKFIRTGLPLTPFLALATLVAHPSLWGTIARFIRNSMVTEQAFSQLVTAAPRLQELKPFLIAFINSQKINPSLFLLAQSLKHEGYPLFVLSNIWTQALEPLRSEIPELTLFDGFYTPDNSNGYAHKPQEIFYEDFRTYVANLGYATEKIIFIDNSLANIIGANNAGIYGLLFTSPAELTCQLHEIGITILDKSAKKI
jgi:FMN phosphatase YigB (HAD superfamily)